MTHIGISLFPFLSFGCFFHVYNRFSRGEPLFSDQKEVLGTFFWR